MQVCMAFPTKCTMQLQAREIAQAIMEMSMSNFEKLILLESDTQLRRQINKVTGCINAHDDQGLEQSVSTPILRDPSQDAKTIKQQMEADPMNADQILVQYLDWTEQQCSQRQQRWGCLSDRLERMSRTQCRPSRYRR